jgi:nicotinamidase-related amidase
LVRIFRERNRPIVHVVRLYRSDGFNVGLCRRQEVEQGKRVVLPGTEGAELVDELKPLPDVRLDAERLMDDGLQQIGAVEWVMYKPRWGLSTGLLWKGICATPGVNTIMVCGCNFPNCPRATISGLLSYPTQRPAFMSRACENSKTSG